MARSPITIEIISLVLDKIPLTDKSTFSACCLVAKAVYPLARARLHRDPPFLSSDVLTEILQHIDVQDRATLYACALTSKEFLPPARARLYSSLQFSIAKDTGAQITHVTDSNYSLLLTPASAQLHTTLLYRPDFGVHVKEARIYTDDYPAPGCSEALKSLLLRFLRGRCTRLSTLYLDRLGTEGLTALAQFGSQVVHLDFRAGEWIDTAAVEILGRLTGLKTLHGIIESDLPASPSPPLKHPAFQLYDFMAHCEVGEDCFHLILHHTRNSLTHLELVNASWRSGEGWDLSPYIALTSLSLRINGSWPICYDGGKGGLINTIKTCSNLTHLKIWGDNWSEEPEDEEPFFHHLPPTLTSLVLDEVWAPYAELASQLAEPTILPSLRNLVLSDALQPYEEESTVEGRVPAWQPYNRLRARMADIETLCKRRSVELRWEL